MSVTSQQSEAHLKKKKGKTTESVDELWRQRGTQAGEVSRGKRLFYSRTRLGRRRVSRHVSLRKRNHPPVWSGTVVQHYDAFPSSV